MSKILELRQKRSDTWDKAKKFLDDHRGEDCLISPEDTATYEKMEQEVVDLGKEIEPSNAPMRSTASWPAR